MSHDHTADAQAHRPWRNIHRRKCRQIHVGSVAVGGDAPISVQSMTNTETTDVSATVAQIDAIAQAGARYPVEEKVGEAYALGKIGGFCHLYIGQEAVSTGILSMLRPDDYVITTYRDHGVALAKGMSCLDQFKHVP